MPAYAHCQPRTRSSDTAGTSSSVIVRIVVMGPSLERSEQGELSIFRRGGAVGAGRAARAGRGSGPVLAGRSAEAARAGSRLRPLTSRRPVVAGALPVPAGLLV